MRSSHRDEVGLTPGHFITDGVSSRLRMTVVQSKDALGRIEYKKMYCFRLLTGVDPSDGR